MRCPNCQAALPDGSAYCQYCGSKIITNQNQVNNTPIEITQNQVENSSTTGKKIGFGILSWIIPLFGWVYGSIKKKEEPKISKICIITATVSFAVNLIIRLIPLIFNN